MSSSAAGVALTFTARRQLSVERCAHICGPRPSATHLVPRPSRATVAVSNRPSIGISAGRHAREWPSPRHSRQATAKRRSSNSTAQAVSSSAQTSARPGVPRSPPSSGFWRTQTASAPRLQILLPPCTGSQAHQPPCANQILDCALSAGLRFVRGRRGNVDPEHRGQG
jgi:hypothetical protein